MWRALGQALFLLLQRRDWVWSFFWWPSVSCLCKVSVETIILTGWHRLLGLECPHFLFRLPRGQVLVCLPSGVLLVECGRTWITIIDLHWSFQERKSPSLCCWYFLAAALSEGMVPVAVCQQPLPNSATSSSPLVTMLQSCLLPLRNLLLSPGPNASLASSLWTLP